MYDTKSEQLRLPGGARVAVLALAAGWMASAAHAALSLGAPFGDGVVLQRDQPVPVWGWTDPGQTVAVELAGRTQSVRADTSGRWR